jgi:poly(A)-specific ribonuclease
VQALDKSKCRDGLRALRRYIPRLQQDLELLHARAGGKVGKGTEPTEETPETDIDGAESRSISSKQLENSEKLKEIIDRQDEGSEDGPDTDLGIASDSEDLSDIFETDSDADTEETSKRPLYLEEFEKFSVEADGEPEDFEEHLRQISLGSKKGVTSGKDVDIPTGVDVDSPSFDEVDRMFLRAASLLKRKKR